MLRNTSISASAAGAILLLALCACPSQAQQGLEGWQNTASGGNARSLPDNVSSVFGNPAATSSPRRTAGGLGVSGLGGSNMELWSSWVFPVGEDAVLGAGIIEPDPGALDNHRVNFTGVSHLFKGSWLGVQGNFQKIPTAIKFDLGVGGMHRVNNHLRFGWDAHNLTESLDTLACDGCDKRQFGVGASWYFDQNERYAVFTDAGLSDFQFKKYKRIDPSGGVRLEFGTNRNLQLMGSLQLSHLDSTQFLVNAAGGLAFQQYFFSTLVNAKYSLTGLALRGNRNVVPEQQVSIGIVLDAFVDRTPPRPLVRSDVALLSSSGADSLPRQMDFMLRVEEESGKLDDWSLVIFSAKPDMKPSQLVRRFQGKGYPPKSIRWAGDDVVGIPCLTGLYAYRLIVKDAAGNQAWTEWQHLEIK